jgi:cobalt-precorrin-5B (C1)-methyltransferase
MTKKPEGPLRRGWTTGACATAAAKAAFSALLGQGFPDPVSITLPKGEKPSFPLAEKSLSDGMALAAIVKDAGDDPDVTHGALIRVTLRRLEPGAGIRFRAGLGVGIVTRAGLPVPPGEAAINPAPRRMIEETLAELAAQYGTHKDAEVEISVPGGEELAKKTWNPRLGITGGISILGTTGIVHPYSCSAWIASIHRGIDVIRAAGLTHAAACTGSTTEAAVKACRDLPDFAFIDMGDFVGGMLKYLRHHPIPRLTIAGGFGKIAKLAEGHLDLHSGRSQLDLSLLAKRAALLGASDDVASGIAKANSAMEALDIARRADLKLGDALAKAAQKVAHEAADGKIDIELLIYDRKGDLVGHADFAQ